MKELLTQEAREGIYVENIIDWMHKLMNVIYLLVVSIHLDLIAGMGFNLSLATG